MLGQPWLIHVTFQARPGHHHLGSDRGDRAGVSEALRVGDVHLIGGDGGGGFGGGSGGGGGERRRTRRRRGGEGVWQAPSLDCGPLAAGRVAPRETGSPLLLRGRPRLRGACCWECAHRRTRRETKKEAGYFCQHMKKMKKCRLDNAVIQLINQ